MATLQFEVETGTGSPTATAYITVEEFRQYWINRGQDYNNVTTYPENTIKVWVNLATEYIDNYYQNKFKGVRYDEDQALQWPRIALLQSSSNEINNYPEIFDKRQDRWYSYSEIPQSLKDAVAEMARAVESDPDLYGVGTGIKSKRLGPGAITYDGFTASGIKEYRALNLILAGLIDSKGLERV